MLKNLAQNKHFKYGAPFMIVVVGGSFIVSLYSQVRYDVQKDKKLTVKPEVIAKLAESNTKPLTLEQAHQDYMESVNLDEWKNIRGPRPWEEGGDEKNEDFRKLIEKRAEESKRGWIFKM